MIPGRTPQIGLRRRALVAAAGLAASATWRPTAAQRTWPSQALRIVVPFTPGGSTDILARAIGQELHRTWGQPVVVDNVPGAGGSIGADRVALWSALAGALAVLVVSALGRVSRQRQALLRSELARAEQAARLDELRLLDADERIDSHRTHSPGVVHKPRERPTTHRHPHRDALAGRVFYKLTGVPRHGRAIGVRE